MEHPHTDHITANGPLLGTGVSRRNFIALSGISLASSALGTAPRVAGPFSPGDFERLIPADKKLRPEWVRSLAERGRPAIYTNGRGELRYIGMPVGGICCGAVYLGGDGRLWLWDIFNRNQLGVIPQTVTWNSFHGERSINPMEGANYVAPSAETAPFSQGFAARINGRIRTMDAMGWNNIEFRGQYPIGIVHYSDPGSPVSAELTAYSPFIPLNADDSGLPVTLCEFKFTNHSSDPVELAVGGWLQNACSFSTKHSGTHVNRAVTIQTATGLAARFEPAEAARADLRPDILIDDFEHDTYGAWQVEGDAFGAGPVRRSAIPAYQGDVGGEGDRVVNSHASAPDGDVGARDSHTGSITSPPFTIKRRYISFYIGGGSNVAQVGIRLIVDGKPVLARAGHNDNHMRLDVFRVDEFAGKQAVIQIYDHGTGPWGNIGIDQIAQTDRPPGLEPLELERDYGTMTLALLGSAEVCAETIPAAMFDVTTSHEARAQAGHAIIGAVRSSVRLAPGRTHNFRFVIAWHFKNNHLNVPGAATGTYYSARFSESSAVVAYVEANYGRLSRDTRLWRDTWYDSTLPYWFLDRTFANTCILATTTAHRFATGRFWGWEGVGCCEGTCTHVWHYAQAVGRIFPEIERHQREYIDFGAAFDLRTGQIGYRGEGTGPAVDGQCGRILGAYREHQMSADGKFLSRIWPRVRRAMEFMMRYDRNGDGLLAGAQDNTLDAAWYGEIAWLSSLYAAALAACARMAAEAADTEFSQRCEAELARSQATINSRLFNGEYFIQRPEPGREQALGTYQTCHIDQVHGQSWAWQVSLGRILDREKTLSALKSLYRYNFAPDVGPFRARNWPGRAYALAGEGGLIMATNPREIPHAFGNSADWQYGYFNECMSGFEHQAASHMIAEGLVTEGLAVTRAIHDRYHAARRNPYNEVECSDHYARSMASYGSFITMCGFEYHGPDQRIGFSPKLRRERFRAAFTAAEGWGSFSQEQTSNGLLARLEVKYGKLALRTVALHGHYGTAAVTGAGRRMAADVKTSGEQSIVYLAKSITLHAGQSVELRLS